jgi:diguanylate cyclase (GGDEF)-like protein
VSRSHARITVNGSECTIEDLGSSNKTIINGQTLGPAQPTRLRNNDQIKTGNIIFKFLEKGSLETITHQELTEKAMKDALTGAFTKGALLEKGPEAMKRSDFLKEELSVVVFDIDFFKKINDTYGHPCGDYVLKHLAHVVGTKLVRANDYFARYGGEEFVILLSGAAMTRAMDVAERVRSTVQATEFEFEGHKIPVTVSLGVASRIPTETEWDDLFQRADDALYVSKRNGRNRVTAA